MVVLVGAKYFGSLLHCARKHNGINTNDIARMFGTSARQMRKYERGIEIIPENILLSVFYHGLCLMRCKKGTKKPK